MSAQPNKKVVVVDDDTSVQEVTRAYLERDGYLVYVAGTAAEGLAVAERVKPGLVVLDLMLPDRSGEDVCREIRERSDVPILMLTAKASEDERVAGLALGADDYLTKPFSPRTLIARVRALLRRAGAEEAPEPLVAGPFVLDLERRTLGIEGRSAVRLTQLELRLAQMLLARAGEAVPSERLVAHVWGARGDGDRQLLKQLVHRLRQKIEPDPRSPRWLVTEPGEGYRLLVAP